MGPPKRQLWSDESLDLSKNLDELLSKEPFENWDKNLYRFLEEI